MSAQSASSADDKREDDLEQRAQQAANQGDLEAGLRLCQEIVSLRESRTGRNNGSSRTAAHANLGIWLSAIGRYTEAEVALEKAISVARQSGFSGRSPLAQIHMARGCCLHSLGCFAEAREAFEESGRLSDPPRTVHTAILKHGGRQYESLVLPVSEDEREPAKDYVWVYPLEAVSGMTSTHLLGEVEGGNSDEKRISVTLAAWQPADCDHGNGSALLPGHFAFNSEQDSDSRTWGVLVQAEGHEGVFGRWDGKRRNPLSGLPMVHIYSLLSAPEKAGDPSGHTHVAMEDEASGKYHLRLTPSAQRHEVDE